MSKLTKSRTESRASSRARHLGAWTRRPLAVVALAALTACTNTDSSAQRRGGRTSLEADSMGLVPTDVTTIKLRARRELTESSAAATSVAQPGIIFSLNDSGNEPVLYAFDSTGADRGAWRIAGARNVDWEAAALGPCATGGAAAPASTGPRRCVYIGDVGDNAQRRATSVIYRVPEPAPLGRHETGELAAERLTFRYADRAHNVEAMYVAPDGAVDLITKPRLFGATRRLRPALIFRIPSGAWGRADTVVAEQVDSLPALVPGSAPMRVITDAALSPDARYLAVRTYWQVYIFAADSATGRVVPSVRPSVCNVIGLGEETGEGIGWWGTTRKLVLTSEGRKSPMHVIACPLPR